MSKKKPPKNATPIELCINDLIDMHNEYVALSSGQGDAAAMATATCVVNVDSALGIASPQIDQLRANLGLEAKS